MDQETAFQTTALEALNVRITGFFPTQIISCVEELSEEQLWWRPNDSSNSVGNLVLHLSGSLRHYLCHSVGGFPYERDRATEFSERGGLPKEQVLAIFQDTMAQAAQVFASLDTARLLEPTAEPAYNPTVFHLLFNVALHLATHAGQIVFITKMLKEGAVDELWIRAYRNQ